MTHLVVNLVCIGVAGQILKISPVSHLHMNYNAPLLVGHKIDFWNLLIYTYKLPNDFFSCKYTTADNTI